MTFFSLVVITMVFVTINVQSQGLFDPMTSSLSKLDSKSDTKVAISLQAASVCKCAEKFYLAGNFTSCNNDDGFNIRQLAQDIAQLIPTCSNLKIPLIGQVAKAVPSGLKLNTNARKHCQCAYERYVHHQVESCEGTSLYNPIKVVLEMSKNLGCETNGQDEDQTNGLK